ncbi:MAG: chemotaxis protein CheW [Pseudomonadota bacterium]
MESDNNKETSKTEQIHQYITMRIGHQLFGVSVNHVVDVQRYQKITPIPLTRREILGSLNLRGRIVTNLDIRVLLEIDDKIDIEKSMSIVVEHGDELYSLVVDKVGDVVSVKSQELVKNPDNLSKLWQEVSLGIFPMQEELVVILDLDKIMPLLLEEK